MVFFRYLLVTFFVVLNVVIAIVLDQFQTTAGEEGLLTTASFFETVRRKMLLEKFASKLRSLSRRTMLSKAEQREAQNKAWNTAPI